MGKKQLLINVEWYLLASALPIARPAIICPGIFGKIGVSNRQKLLIHAHHCWS